MPVTTERVEVENSLTATAAPTDHFPPYPASVVDRFLAWVDDLPLPAWLFYLLLLLVLLIIFNGLAWIDGSLRFPALDLYRSSVPVYPVASLALVHYLNQVAQRALAAFRPALGAGEEAYERFAYMLVTLPRRGTWITLALSLLFTAAYILFTPSLVDLFGRSPWVAIVEALIYVFAFAMIAVFLFHTIWQLRMVSRIHASATNVNLFRRTPLYAFSYLTARTGISLLLMNYFGVLTDPATFENLALIILTVAASLVAILCFVLPLRGIHNQIVAEKNRLRDQCTIRLESAIEMLYTRADAQDLSAVEDLNHLLASLVETREIVEKIRTWPWEQETLVSFISVFLLPLIGRLILGILSQLEPLAWLIS